MSVQRELFGGAITAIAPTRLIDASELRQVPDTQEVLLYPDSDASIIVEVLERVEASHFNDAVKFHFDSLAYDNAAERSEVQATQVIPNDRGDDTPSAITLTGTQMVKKFNRAHADEVRVFMALYRVEAKRVDLVVTCNAPLRSELYTMSEAEYTVVQADFNTFIRSLRIVDHGLFA